MVTVQFLSLKGCVPNNVHNAQLQRSHTSRPEKSFADLYTNHFILVSVPARYVLANLTLDNCVWPRQ